METLVNALSFLALTKEPLRYIEQTPDRLGVSKSFPDDVRLG